MRATRAIRGVRALLAAAGLLLAAVAAGCGAQAHAGRASAQTVPVTERDFHISAPTRLPAGNYRLLVHNEGATDHELIIAPSANGELPLRPDGLTVDEEALEREEPGSLEPGKPGAVRALDVHLAPGRYVLFCNMEGHYMAGMHTELVVG
jgi:hypothetical protein